MYVQLTAAQTGRLRPIAKLGPWCIVGREANGSLWNDHLATAVDPERLELAFHRILEPLSDWLNRTHNVDRSVEYWELILYRFLHNYIRHVAVRRDILARTFATNSNHTAVVLDVASYQSPESDAEFNAASRRSDRLNLQMFSQIAQALDLPTIQLPNREFQYPAELENILEKKRPLKAKVRSLLKQLYQRRCGQLPTDLDDKTIVLFESHFPAETVRELQRSSNYRLRLAGSICRERRGRWIDRRMRSSLTSFDKLPELERCIIHSLKYNVPRDYVERYRLYKRRASRALKAGTPKLIVGGSFADAGARVWLAECRHRGSSLNIIQHGGSYGETAGNTWEDSERRLADTFVTWGWSGERTVAMPAPRLIKALQSVQCGTGSKILITLRGEGRYPGNRPELPADFLPQFLRELEGELRENVIVRMRMGKGGIKEDCCRWLSEFPEVSTDLGSDLIFQALTQSRLVVTNYAPSTTFLECLAVDRPAIVLDPFWRQRVRESARPYYDALQGVGIVHDDPVEAGRLVQSVFARAADWWSESHRRAAVDRYRQQFARTSDRPVEEWRRFLTSQLENTTRRGLAKRKTLPESPDEIRCTQP